MTKLDNRFSLILDDSGRQKLAATAKTYKLTQGEIIELLLDNMDKQVMDGVFKQFRDDKVKGRGNKKELLAKFKTLTPEQIAVIEKMTAAQ